MESPTPDELYVLSCALNGQREQMFTDREDYSAAEHYALGSLINRLTTELDRREARCACLHPRSVHGTSYCDECACDGWVPR